MIHDPFNGGGAKADATGRVAWLLVVFNQ